MHVGHVVALIAELQPITRASGETRQKLSDVMARGFRRPTDAPGGKGQPQDPVVSRQDTLLQDIRQIRFRLYQTLLALVGAAVVERQIVSGLRMIVCDEELVEGPRKDVC